MRRERTADIDSYTLDLLRYYKDKGLTIVGLNDSQGFYITPTFFRKGLLEELAFALTGPDLKPEVINAFSLTMNKTEHIDYFLKNNLSLEEIKLSQIYSAISALEKSMSDAGFPKFLGQIGNFYRLIYSPKAEDRQIKIASSLKSAAEPVVIYSSGANNLMREVGSNPNAIKKAYALRDKKLDYYYALGRIDDPVTLSRVLDSVKKNFDNILGINEKTDIYALGSFIPQSLHENEMEAFKDFILMYNDQLCNLCNQYAITFVDTAAIADQYSHGSHLHIFPAANTILANHILKLMHHNKFDSTGYVRGLAITECEISDNGALGVLKEILKDYGESCDRACFLRDYDAEREKEIAEEHGRESKVFFKVLSNKEK